VGIDDRGDEARDDGADAEIVECGRQQVNAFVMDHVTGYVDGGSRGVVLLIGRVSRNKVCPRPDGRQPQFAGTLRRRLLRSTIRPRPIRPELREMGQGARDRAILGAYQAAIDRLDALAYRLSEAAATPAKPEPARSIAAPASPQRNLPLGPVVIARKPKRR
jgi:hypothetical protein